MIWNFFFLLIACGYHNKRACLGVIWSVLCEGYCLYVLVDVEQVAGLCSKTSRSRKIAVLHSIPNKSDHCSVQYAWMVYNVLYFRNGVENVTTSMDNVSFWVSVV